MSIREADNPVNSVRLIHTASRSSGPAARQPTFDWKATDKYQKLCNFEIKVKNIFITNTIIHRETRGSQ